MTIDQLLLALVATYFGVGALIYFIVGITGQLWKEDGLIFFWPILMVVCIIALPFWMVRRAGTLGEEIYVKCFERKVR